MRGVPVYLGSSGAFVAPAQHRLYFLPEPHGQGPLREGADAVACARAFLDANVGLLDGTHRKKVFHWQCTLDGKTFSPLPPTPTASTTIAGLPPLATVGFQVSVTVNKQPQGPWSQTVSILVV